MRIFFVSIVLIFTLLYQAWGQHFLVKTKDNDKSFLIKTKDDHIEPIEGNEANEDWPLPIWLKKRCWGIPCNDLTEGRWMWGKCSGKKLQKNVWDEESWEKCVKDCRHITNSTGCAYTFEENKCTAYRGRIIRRKKKENTMCIIFPEKNIETSWEKDFEETLEKAKEKFKFIWQTDDPAYWCKVRSEDIWVFWCRRWKKNMNKWTNSKKWKKHKRLLKEWEKKSLKKWEKKSCTIGKKSGMEQKRRNEAEKFCEERIDEKREICEKQSSSSTRMGPDITCNIVPDS